MATTTNDIPNTSVIIGFRNDVKAMIDGLP